MVTNLATAYILPLPITLRNKWPNIPELCPNFIVFWKKVAVFFFMK